MKRKERLYFIDVPQGRGEVLAKSVGHAVHRFRRKWFHDWYGEHLTLQTDHETGGWKGVSVEIVP